ncbi:hypothetical protein A2954_03385 [Candidatus Roizmanbacteria bacterium RIFCSPLOWO2_01_FULL_37_12]|uniref:Uncharacterized protein n=1 Tax=Candidatus Roizmanbacteria bacterium RIFCSPLOWO2_01_FULL_37_12 TaxID=1802056 RepID=A0A1F7IFD8_9BACT|nr:MAG: hypothetical protein A2768_01570 [Candidatus Roizmanbacteria bacterium RIFCSPHIGHO2_01_FULL_37_16]OGK25313.1 MAG: hypothetical protein A3D76_00780 [Candidatus Roizmanbacteria bacterium RIFCSPHIGHO2_02_FULL_37_9b]OGK42069.1 MAG: hypothetical protein A2954_03385 [Candidatus Roizmanbacteria bacterium RIFCSPLOWO2_01_FULL_37_12]
MSVTHTASVFILGIAALILTRYIIPDQIIRWLNIFSGLLVFGFGLYLLIVRSKKLIYRNPQGSHAHNLHEHLKITWKSLLPLGISEVLFPVSMLWQFL